MCLGNLEKSRAEERAKLSCSVQPPAQPGKLSSKAILVCAAWSRGGYNTSLSSSGTLLPAQWLS